MSIQPIRKVVRPEIPDKLYFRIGDVARICEVPAYVLRFWETEFPQLRPNKGGTGQRLYRKRDVEMALRIKSLLYDQGYTIPGARQVFKEETKPKEPTAAIAAPLAPASESDAEISGALPLASRVRLRALREELQEVLAILSRPVGQLPAPRPKLQAVKPRLVAEPRPAPSGLRLAADVRAQGDLFAAE